MNSDGSTNNLSAYVCHNRINMKRQLIFWYVRYLFWAVVSGAFCFFNTFHSFGSIISSNGQVNNVYNTSVCVYLSIVVAHHLQLFIETRSFNPGSIFFYLWSLFLVTVVIVLNNEFKFGSYVGYYYKNQFNVLLASPLFYVCLLLNVFVICLPNIINRILVDVIFYPEFTKIKGQ